MKLIYIFVLLVCLPMPVASKVLIITHNYNTPEFVSIQNKTFKKFLKDEFQFVVFSDAITEAMHQKILQACIQEGLACVRIPQTIHLPPYYLPMNMPSGYSYDPVKPSNVRHVHAVQYSLNTLGFNNDDIVVLIDSDMFLIRPLSFADYMKDHDIIAAFTGSSNAQGKSISYCCPQLTFLNMKTLPEVQSLNFNCGIVDGCIADSGGATHYYMKQHPSLRLKSIQALNSGHLFCSDRYFPNHNEHNVQVPYEQKLGHWINCGFNEREIQFLSKNPDTIQFFKEGEDCWFVHYRGGTNYENLPQSYYVNKKRILDEFLNDILS